MSPVNYINMNDQELKQYLLEHKDNKEAFYAYLDRKQQYPQQAIVDVNELDTLTPDRQIELIAQRLQEKFNL
jgi:hypothetical protein